MYGASCENDLLQRKALLERKVLVIEFQQFFCIRTKMFPGNENLVNGRKTKIEKLVQVSNGVETTIYRFSSYPIVLDCG